MAANRDGRVALTKFSGIGHLHSDLPNGLAAVLRDVLQKLAAIEVEAGSFTAVTDNSAGGDTITVTNATDIVNLTAHGLQTGDGPLQFTNSGGALPAGIVAATAYWAIRVDADDFKIATSKANAVAETAVDITDDGTGTQTLHYLGLKAVTMPVAADTSSAGGATVASVNASMDTLKNAHAEVIAIANEVRALLGMGAIDEGPGATADFTIAAIDVDVDAASGNSSASISSVTQAIEDVLTLQKVAAMSVSECRVAVGLAPIAMLDGTVIQGKGVDDDLAATLHGGADIANAAAVAAGTSATTGVTEVAIEAALVAMQDNIDGLVEAMATVKAVTATTNPLKAYAA